MLLTRAPHFAFLSRCLRPAASHQGELRELYCPRQVQAFRTGDGAGAIITAVGQSSDGFSRTLVVISSDLAHYPREADARAIDREILAAFASMDSGKLLSADKTIMGRKIRNLACTMCGLDAAYVGLKVARAAGASTARIMTTHTIADAGIGGEGSDSVVGYGSALLPAQSGSASTVMALLDRDEQAFLLRIARASIAQYLQNQTIASFAPPGGSTHAVRGGRER